MEPLVYAVTKLLPSQWIILILLSQKLIHGSANKPVASKLLPNYTFLIERATDRLWNAAYWALGVELFPDGALRCECFKGVHASMVVAGETGTGGGV